MDRRRFLSLLLSILGTAALGSTAYPLLRFLAPPETKARAEKLTVNKGQIPSGKAKEIIFGTTPAIIINIPGKGYIALSKVCTHLGCLVEYNEDKGKLICPCHAGVFDLEGRVVSGPPPKPLLRLPLSVKGENIIIG